MSYVGGASARTDRDIGLVLVARVSYPCVCHAEELEPDGQLSSSQVVVRMMRGREASERFAERRRRENEAPRLRDVVPRLRACRIDIEEGRDSATSADIKHTRRIVVEHAPALFVISCGDPGCKDGGHDVTTDILRGLREGRETVVGEDRCYGHLGMTDCGRLMRFTVSAVYEPGPTLQPNLVGLTPSA